MTVGQGPIALAVGAGGGCLDIFSLIYLFSFLSPSLWETARYRLQYCLKGPLNPKQPTNQIQDKNGPGFRIKRTMFLDKMGPVLGNYSINYSSEPLEIWYETFRSGLFPSLFIYSPEGPEMPCGRRDTG